MAFTKQVSIATLLLACVSSSCSKKDSSTTTPTPTPTPTGITFKVDGTSVSCDSANAVLYTSSLTSKRMIDVYGFKAGLTVLEFHFQPKTGSLPADKTFDNSWLTWANATDYFDSKSGTMKLTKCDTTTNNIEATFDFVGENFSKTATHSITEGTMNLNKITKH